MVALASMGCEEFEVGPEIATDLPELEIVIPADLAEGEGAGVASVFYFEDPDGDVVEGTGVVYPESGFPVRYGECRSGFPEDPQESVACVFAVSQDLFETSFDGLTEGRMVAAFGVEPVPADYVVEVWLIDANGFESNHISTTVHLVAE